MLIIRDIHGKERGRIDFTVPGAFGKAKGMLGNGWTIWQRKPVTKVLFDQVTHHKDKVSRVYGKVQSARVGGQHSSSLVHKVETGEFREVRVW